MLLRGLVWGAPSPSSLDPVHRIAGSLEDVQLIGRVESDARRWSGSCSVLLAARGSWSRLTSSKMEVIGRAWTPIADLRRRIRSRLQQLAGPERGGLLAALVLGSAQVQLPADLRQIFRVAGQSHAAGASGLGPLDRLPAQCSGYRRFAADESGPGALAEIVVAA